MKERGMLNTCMQV